MTNREYAIEHLRVLLDAQLRVGGACQRAFAILDRASTEGRDIDNRELGVIKDMARTLPMADIQALDNKGNDE